MRLSMTLFLLSFAGALFGGGLIGRWCVGLVVLAYALTLGVFALLRDDEAPPVSDMRAVRERARRAA